MVAVEALLLAGPIARDSFRQAYQKRQTLRRLLVLPGDSRKILSVLQYKWSMFIQAAQLVK